jgi:phosphoglucomutase/phosphomannomutase
MPEIRDKDAGAASLLLAELALDQKRRGKTVRDYQDALDRQFGYFCNKLVNIAMSGIEGKQQMTRMLDALRKSPLREIGGLAVSKFEDLRSEACWMGSIKGATDFAARNFLLFHLGDRARIALRPSGTEPKAKAYIEVCCPPCGAGVGTAAWESTCRQVDEVAKNLSDDFLAKALSMV